ncbi:MAG TPA: hypothetical protein VN408_06545 [Actinoplanes sp.]|nr:hypothetical protein [Actinoplanes sp.]
MGSLDTPTTVGGGDVLIDITRVPLEKLAGLESAQLRRLTERFAREAAEPSSGTLYSFGSFI